MTFTCPLQDLHEQYVNSKANKVYKIAQNASGQFMYSDLKTYLHPLLSLVSQNSEDERRGFALNSKKIKFKMLYFHVTCCYLLSPASRESTGLL